VAADSSLADFSTLMMEVIRSPKRRYTQDLQGATSQKTAFFIVTAMKTSNLTIAFFYHFLVNFFLSLHFLSYLFLFRLHILLPLNIFPSFLFIY
jgi:hypothetical protein